MIMQVNPVIDYTVKKMCVRPYHNHKKGCPNFNKKEGCPPNSKNFNDVFDLSRPIYAIVNAFNLGIHVENLKCKFPEWSDYQLKCVLYWQPKARKQLRILCERFLELHSEYVITMCPEAMGVDVVKTMEDRHVNIEFPVQTIAYQIAFAGILKR